MKLVHNFHQGWRLLVQVVPVGSKYSKSDIFDSEEETIYVYQILWGKDIGCFFEGELGSFIDHTFDGSSDRVLHRNLGC